MSGLLPFERTNRDYYAGRRLRESAIQTLGELGWTVREIAVALGVSQPTVRASVAYIALCHEGRFGYSRTNAAWKLRSTIRKLAEYEALAAPTAEERIVRAALQNVLSDTSRPS